MKKLISLLIGFLMVVSCAVLTASAGEKPSYGKIPVLEAEYGTLLSDVMLPPIDNGTFLWDEDYPETQTVGKVGKNTFYATYIPADRVKYDTVNDIEVIISVKLPEYTAYCGQVLADIKLPEGWAWCVKSPENKKLEYGKSTQPAACPSISSYDVVINTKHNMSEKYKYDENGHWQVCIGCGEKGEYDRHIMSIQQNNETGEEYRICEICGYVITAAKGDDTDNDRDASPVAEFFRNLISRIKAFFERLFGI